jgi:NADH dehydrogenase
MASGPSTNQIFCSDLTSPHSRPRVLVIGAGFAGINAAKDLASRRVDVTVVDRNNHHTFSPLLYQVATAALSPSDIASPIRSILRDAPNVRVVMDEVVSVDIKKKRVMLRSGATLIYDYLIAAAGSTGSYFGHPEWEPYAPSLKTLEDAVEIRRRILLAFEKAEVEAFETGLDRPLDFLIVGGGPTGVELAGAIAEIVDFFLKRDFRSFDPQRTRVLLIEGGPRILPTYPPDLSEKAVLQLEKLGVVVHTGMIVEEIGAGFVRIKGGVGFQPAVTIWGAGVATSPVAGMLGVPTDRRGRVIVDRTLNPEGHPEIFICGDLAVFSQDGHEIPGVAQPAMQMGKHAARMIRQDIQQAPRSTFRYFDKGNMATIGRYAAVGEIYWPFRAHWSGLIAWFTWLMVHVTFLIGFRNRISVLFQWAWTYLSLQRDNRLIVGDKKLSGWRSASTIEPS